MNKYVLTSAILSLTLTSCAPRNDKPHETNVGEPETQKVFKTYPAQLFHQTISYGLANSGGYTFSHDGSKLLISSDKSGIFNAYTLSLDGVSTPMTSSTDFPYYAQSFFPKDDRILLQGDQGGNELDHVFVRAVSGDLTDLTPGDKVKASFIGWHENGNDFYISTNERDPSSNDVYLYHASDYSRELVFKNRKLNIGAISPDGKYLSLVQTITSANADIFIIDLTKKEAIPELITKHIGNISYGVYGFTPDSQNLAFATDEFGEFNQAWTYNIASGDKKLLLKTDWNVSYITYSPSGRYRVSAVNADGVTEVEIFDTNTKTPVVLTGVQAGELSQIRFNSDESKMAFGLNTDTSPRNIFVANLSSGEARKLTTALPEGISEDNLVTASIVRYSSFDGLQIPSILYMPKQASAKTPVPALVWVHGGPGGQSTKGYSAMIQHLVNHGYAVLAANNRGSSGYGKTFYHLDDRKHGEDDLVDIVYARVYLEGLSGIDKDRIGIIGGSYGGYMTMAALAFHPDVFDVGVNIFGVTNWERTLKSIPAFWGAFRDALYDEMGDPATDQERHRRISPLFHAETITKPLYVVQGANDPRVLQVESDEMVKAVRANGVEVDYVLFPDEGHGFQKRKNRITNSERIVQFLDKNLKGLETE
ncbi:MAG: S9 family peptidase [Robiginitomaculum sp.]|nr:S9 family peptidase [Robiginitomaculum sp.]